MKTSDSLDKIAPALLAAQLEVGNAAKNAKNPHFRNDYANLESVIDAIKAPLNKHGIAVLQGVGETVGGVLQVTTRLLHTSGQWIEATASSPVSKADPQGVGSAVTYLRRYSASAMLFLTQTDDDGEAARHDNTPPPPPKKLTAAQATALTALSLQPDKKERLDKALAFYYSKQISDLTEEQAATILKKLTS